MKAQHQKIEAVFDKDLEKVLRGLNLYDKVMEGGINCYFCNRKITLGNLQFIFSKDGEIKVSCGEQDCVDKFRKNIRGGN